MKDNNLYNMFFDWMFDQLAKRRDSNTDRIVELLQSNHKEIMSTLKTVFEKMDSTSMAIIEAIATETDEIKADVTKARESGSADDFAKIEAGLESMKTKAVDAIKGMVPTMESPTSPTPPSVPPINATSPVVMPEELEEIEVPIEVKPSPDGVGVDGGSELSFEEE